MHFTFYHDDANSDFRRHYQPTVADIVPSFEHFVFKMSGLVDCENSLINVGFYLTACCLD